MEIKLLLGDAFKTILVVLRLTAIFAVLPIFGLRSVPVHIKIVVGIVVSLALSMGLRGESVVPVRLDFSMIVLAAREVFIGLTLGFLASFIFRGVELAGEIIGTQMGFAIANVFDPMTERQICVIGEFQRVLLVLLFFAINGHHIILTAIYRSYELLPLGSMAVNPKASLEILRLGGQVFSIGVQLAAPAIIMLLLVHVALGVISRTVPQMNVFIIGFPVTIAIGVFMLAISMPAFISMLQTLVGHLFKDLVVVTRALA